MILRIHAYVSRWEVPRSPSIYPALTCTLFSQCTRSIKGIIPEDITLVFVVQVLPRYSITFANLKRADFEDPQRVF